MGPPVRLRSIDFTKAFFRPGEPVHWRAALECRSQQPISIRITATVRRLNAVLATLRQEAALEGQTRSFNFTWQPPDEAPAGYGVDIRVEGEDGLLASASAAFDVLEHWTQAPRYGFLTDFYPGRSDVDETLDLLARYHINGLQFYDWMYRHDRFLAGQDPYLDPLGRELSRQTVERLISAAHSRGMAAMPYTAVYGASLDFYHQHPDWALYGPDGQPCFFFDFLAIMDPRPGSPWTEHLLYQFDQVLAELDFDGIHLDQYGEPRVGYDAGGESFDLAEPLAGLIDAAKERVRARRPDGAVIFNAVRNWPIEAVAGTGQDVVYIEVWEPQTRLADLHDLIVQAQALSATGGSAGKPVVLAVYLDPANEPLVRLVDAIIFASGGSHIELGECGSNGGREAPGLLADAYFPKYQPGSSSLSEVLRRYYDFAVRYGEVIGPRTQDTTGDDQTRLEMDFDRAGPPPESCRIWPIVRTGQGYTAFNLINLSGLKSLEWKKEIVESPSPLGPVSIQIKNIEREVAALWLASPDGKDSSPQELVYNQAHGCLSFDLPALLYWSLVVIQWKN